MIEVVTAVYKTSSAAEAAIDDLEAAKVPSAVIRDGAGNTAPLVQDRDHGASQGDRVVDVTVESRHASLVVDILDMQAPVSMTETPCQLDENQLDENR